MKQSITDIDTTNKRIFLRTDFNIPLKDNKITDTYRITSTLPTIDHLLKTKPKSILIGSHLGRPNGNYNAALSLRPVFLYLKGIYKDVVFKNFYDKIDGGLVLFENLRFLEEEENVSNASKFTNYLMENADIAVIDAFGVVHREAASLTKTGLPVYSGLLLSKELECADVIVKDNDIDIIVLGGKKISDKILLIEKLIPKCRKLFVVGGMCFPFLKYKNKKIGNSICEDVNFIDKIYKMAEDNDTEILLPVDFVGVRDNVYKEMDEIEDGYAGVDIGPETVKMLKSEFLKVRKVFWNGPPGIFEVEESSYGTKAMVECLSRIKDNDGMCIVGGGDTASAVNVFGNRDDFYHVSTGGGSLMALIEGQKLPGIEIIENK